MNIDSHEFNSLFVLNENNEQIYGWETLCEVDYNYKQGDIGLINLIGTPEEPKLEDTYLVHSIWESNCLLHEVKYCLDIGKIYLSFVGNMDFSVDHVIYFNIWINVNKRRIWYKDDENLDLLSTRNLLFFYDYWKRNSNFSLGRVNFYLKSECPYIHS